MFSEALLKTKVVNFNVSVNYKKQGVTVCYIAFKSQTILV